MITDMDKLNKAHEKCLELTGDAWCPYMSDLFADALFIVDDQTAREIIEERRTYLFHHFLLGEPQEERLLSLLGG